MFNANTTKQTTGAFRAYLARAAVPNQREICGIMKAVLKMRPSRQTSNHTAVVIDTMKYIVRNKVQAIFPKEVETGHDQFDLALSCQYASMKQ
eukprot:4269286-Heterocapsa_arctica.AAC.1